MIHVRIVAGLEEQFAGHLRRMVVCRIARHDAIQPVQFACSTSTCFALDVIGDDPAGPVRGLADGVVFRKGIVF